MKLAAIEGMWKSEPAPAGFTVASSVKNSRNSLQQSAPRPVAPNFGHASNRGLTIHPMFWRPPSSHRTIVAAIAMLSLRASGDARCRWTCARGGVGSEWGQIGSVGDPRDSAWNRRDGFGVHHQIGRNAGRSGRSRIARSERFRFWDNSPGHLPAAHATGIRISPGPAATGKP